MTTLKQISDFEYYFGGILKIRHSYGEPDEILDLDKEFINNRDEFQVDEFDILVKFNLPIIKVYVHSRFQWLVGDPYLNFELENVKRDDRFPNYSQNGTVNFIMALIRDVIPHKLPLLYDRYSGTPEIYSGRYYKSDDGYDICIHSYNHYHVWCNISGLTLRNLDIKKLDILNWRSTPICEYFSPLVQKYLKKDVSELTDEQIKSIPYNLFK